MGQHPKVTDQTYSILTKACGSLEAFVVSLRLGQHNAYAYLSISARLEGVGVMDGPSSSSGLPSALPLPLPPASRANSVAISSSSAATSADSAEVEASTDLMSTPRIWLAASLLDGRGSWKILELPSLHNLAQTVLNSIIHVIDETQTCMGGQE